MFKFYFCAAKKFTEDKQDGHGKVWHFAVCNYLIFIDPTKFCYHRKFHKAGSQGLLTNQKHYPQGLRPIRWAQSTLL